MQHKLLNLIAPQKSKPKTKNETKMSWKCLIYDHNNTNQK